MSKSFQAQSDEALDNNPAQTRVTFSITTLMGELPGQLYVMAKAMRVGVASVFRHNLSMYAALLDEEERTMALGSKEHVKYEQTVDTIALSHLCRVEGMPDRQSLCDHLTRANRRDLCDVINKSTTIRLLLIIDRARSLSARSSSQTNGRG